MENNEDITPEEQMNDAELNRGSAKHQQLLKLFEDNPEAMNAYLILKHTDKSVFLTGKAGTGKSTFIKLIASLFQNTYIVAPTGIAANNVDGTTIHSAFHLPHEFLLPNDPAIYSKYFSQDDKWTIYMTVGLIIIDEISMVNCSMLDSLSNILQEITGKDEPFGGKKMLFVGDPFQLPPVLQTKDKKTLNTFYKNEHFFESEAYAELDPIKIELNISYRQKEEQFLTCLNNIRSYKTLDDSISLLNKNCYDNKNTGSIKSDTNSIMLAYYNKSANEINEKKLHTLPGELFTFFSEEKGHFNWGNVQAERTLELKVGARIILTKNVSGYYHNGTLAIVTELSADKVIVTTDEGNVLEIEKYEWTNFKKISHKVKKEWISNSVESGSMKQFPIRLAWAITVHKSQGLTFDNVYLLNDGYAFAAGQTYVALSRCRSMEGLRFYKRLNKADIVVDKEILNFYKSVAKEKRIQSVIEGINYDEDLHL